MSTSGAAAGVANSLANGKIWIGDGANLPAQQTMSADGNLAPTGALEVRGWYSNVLDAQMVTADLNKIPRATGSAWSSDFAESGHVGWTPTLTQSAAVAKTINNATCIQIGALVLGWCRLTPTAAGTTNNAVQVSTPVTMKTATLSVGHGFVTLAGVTYRVLVFLSTTGSFVFRRCDVAGVSNLGVDPNAALAAAGDSINFFFVSEAG